jgi:hypothetical protein
MTTHTAHRVSADALSLVKALTTPGEFVPAVWATTVTPAAAHKGRTLLKVTNAVIEVGTPFASLAEVRAAIAAGKRGEVGSLPWGEWIEDGAGYIIGHTGKDGVYREYLRANLAHAGIVSVTCYVDGEEVTREVFDSYLRPSDRSGARPMPATVTIPLSNIRSLGGVTLAA